MDAISDVSRSSEIFSSVPTRPPLPYPFHLDELLGFNNVFSSREKGEELNEGTYFDRSKIFINHVDSFTGKYLVQVLMSKDLQESKLDKNHIGNVMVNGFGEDKSGTNKQRKGKGGTKSIKGKISSKSKGSTTHNKAEIRRNKGKRERVKKSKSTSPRRSLDKENLDFILKEEVKVPYDTSRLTVAEYYDMLDLESGDEREAFLKEKLSKFVEDINTDCAILGTTRKVSYKETTNDYTIIGTLRNDKVPEGVYEIIKESQDLSFIEQIVRCGIIIYIVTEHKEQVHEATLVFNNVLSYIGAIKENEESSQFQLPIFILVSSFMTWAMTKPLSTKEPDLPFTEKDYRKRKPHTNYQPLYELEEQVIKAKNNGEIDAAILVCGIPYGHEEFTFRYLFKGAYQLVDLPIYICSNNIIPVVHVENIAQIVKGVLKNRNEISSPFIFAKDPFNVIQHDIVKAISTNFGTSCYQLVPGALAFLSDDITQDIFDQLTANVCLESCYPLLKRDDIQWKYENGFGTDIENVIKEYIAANDLKPLNIVLYGTAATRTKELASELSKIYRIPYISLQIILNEYFVMMQEHLNQMEKTTTNGVNRNVKDDNYNDRSSLNETLKVCEESDYFVLSLEYFKKLNLKRPSDVNNLTESQKISILKAKLLKDRACLNHGYILDGFPLSLDQTQLLYRTNDVASKESYDTIKFPDYVICLKTADTSVTKVTSEVSQELVYKGDRSSQLSWYAEEAQNKTEEKEDAADEVLVDSTNYFIDTTCVEEPVITFLLEQNSQCKYHHIEMSTGSTAVVVRSILRLIDRGDFTTAAEVMEKSTDIITGQEVEDGVTCKQQLNNSSIQADSLSKLKEAEEMVLAFRSYPLLRYLINFIFPTLTNAILQVTQIRPDDPLDFLAEYLFRHNPDGRMLDPSQSIQEEDILNQHKVFPKVDSKAACLA